MNEMIKSRKAMNGVVLSGLLFLFDNELGAPFFNVIVLYFLAIFSFLNVYLEKYKATYYFGIFAGGSILVFVLPHILSISENLIKILVETLYGVIVIAFSYYKLNKLKSIGNDKNEIV